MSVKIIDFQTYEYVHDDAPGGSHGGTLDPATVTYGVNIDGSENVARGVASEHQRRGRAGQAARHRH
jgi:hypothetical protein